MNRFDNRFWAGLDEDVRKRAAELQKFAASTTAGPLSRIDARLRALMPDLEEVMSPAPRMVSDNPDAFDYAKRASWFYCNQNVTVPPEPRTPSEQAVVDQNFAKLMLEKESEILRSRPTLPQKEQFSNADELQNLLNKNLLHGGNQPIAQPPREAMQMLPGDPKKPAADRVLQMLRELKAKHPEAWSMTMDHTLGDEEATPEQFVEHCKVAAKIDAAAMALAEA